MRHAGLRQAQHSTAQHSTAQHSTAQHSNKPSTPSTTLLIRLLYTLLYLLELIDNSQ